MSTTKHFLKILAAPVFLLAITVALFLASCQKETIKDAVQATSEQAASDLAVQKAILEYNFQVSTDGMSDAQILQLYTQWMNLLPEADRAELLALFQNAMAQEYDFVTGTIASSRASESILSAGIPNDNFGWSTTTVGNKVYVGASRTQKVYEYTKTGGTYDQTAEITPNGASGNFGTSVAVSGAWMAVGASSGSGKVFMYKKQGNAWVQKAILSGPAGDSEFGSGLRMHGSTLAVNSTRLSPLPYKSTISIFTLNGNNWSLSQTLSQPGNYWYTNIDMSADGSRIACAAALNNNLGTPRAHIFVKNGSTWAFEQEVQIVVPGVAICFGLAIDGNTVVMPCLFPGNRQFVVTYNGSSWEVSQEINTPPSGFFQKPVAIQESRIIIGVPSTNNAIPDEVLVYDNYGGFWDYTETLTPGDLGADVRLHSLAINGNTIVAGCFPHIATAAGKAYVWD